MVDFRLEKKQRNGRTRRTVDRRSRSFRHAAKPVAKPL
jgi:hypothetical protein